MTDIPGISDTILIIVKPVCMIYNLDIQIIKRHGEYWRSLVNESASVISGKRPFEAFQYVADHKEQRPPDPEISGDKGRLK